jgi:hypothetical protein
LTVGRNAGLDDILMSMAMVLVVGSTVAVILGMTCISGFSGSEADYR